MNPGFAVLWQMDDVLFYVIDKPNPVTRSAGLLTTEIANATRFVSRELAAGFMLRYGMKACRVVGL